MEVLTHINKRIKSRPLVQVPIEPLLDLYKDPQANSFLIVSVGNFIISISIKVYNMIYILFIIFLLKILYIIVSNSFFLF